jgi:hypothetical protein
MGRALVLLIVAVATGLLVYRWAAPRYLPPENRAVVTTAPAAPQVPESGAAAPAIAAPRSPEQQAQDSLEAQRAPFYKPFRQAYGPLLTEARPDPEDAATLDLYAAGADSQTVSRLLAQPVPSDVYRYGFRRLRYYLPNAPDDAERYRLGAESTRDDQGVWRTFLK